MKKIIINQRNMLIVSALFFTLGLAVVLGHVTGLLSPSAIQASSEDSRLGILGQPAPELDLSDWIDGAGRKMASIRLSANQGKVIYLYFFQDW